MTPQELKLYFDPKQPLPAGNQLRPGVFLDLPDEQYRAFRGLNSSLLKEPTAAEMWHSMTAPPEDHWRSDSEAEKWTSGTLLHWAVLEPFKFADFDKYMVLSPTKGLATERAHRVRHGYPGKLVVSPEMVDLARKCRQALEMNPRVLQTFKVAGSKEVSVFTFDPVHEVWRKARFDWLPFEDAFLADVKTTAFPVKQFDKEARKYGYHLQAKWYLDTWELATGERRRWFRWIVVNKEQPFMSMVYEVENLPKGHVNRSQSHPLFIADEIMDTRLATWVTCAREFIDTMQHVATASESLIRRCWPAYENEDVQLLTF